eukprot:scaffold51466_cov42-Phaeocystis_antarctica.AAC.1
MGWPHGIGFSWHGLDVAWGGHMAWGCRGVGSPWHRVAMAWVATWHGVAAPPWRMGAAASSTHAGCSLYS